LSLAFDIFLKGASTSVVSKKIAFTVDEPLFKQLFSRQQLAVVHPELSVLQRGVIDSTAYANNGAMSELDDDNKHEIEAILRRGRQELVNGEGSRELSR